MAEAELEDFTLEEACIQYEYTKFMVEVKFFIKFFIGLSNEEIEKKYKDLREGDKVFLQFFDIIADKDIDSLKNYCKERFNLELEI